jgi:hypothetical protein
MVIHSSRSEKRSSPESLKHGKKTEIFIKDDLFLEPDLLNNDSDEAK